MNHDITIIGAGIVGLASVLKILEAKPDLRILIIEKENDVCKHQTGNNSGVIHSGIYYKPGSLKAVNCRKGYSELLEFCEKYDITYDLCGKVIVATNENQIETLNNIYERGLQNGLENLKIISAGELKEIEPHVNGTKAILVPQTGIIDFTGVGIKLKEILEGRNCEFVFNQEVKNILSKNDEIIIHTTDTEFRSNKLVCCCGLHSDRVAKFNNKNLQIRIVPFRGEYYKIKESKKHLVKNLIYPVPDPSFPFLGVHFTRMINGDVEAGPNAVLAFKREGYKKTSFSFNDTLETFSWPGFKIVIKKYWKTGLGEFYRSFSKAAFVKALQNLIPEINKEDLIVGGSGVRAQACDISGGLIDDFYFVENKDIVHVCNAPSPAATSSLSIGKFICDKLLGN
ncbi:MAG: L-2-hydroxyglutarate oxidase [Ignavibacteria bacterium]|jgi:L-2-hydroxyglutarate oxidase